MLTWLSWLKWISIFKYGLDVRYGKYAEQEQRGVIVRKINQVEFNLSVNFCLSQAAFINEMSGQLFYSDTTM